jgi:hypothetical protein
MCSNRYCASTMNALQCRRSFSILQIWAYHRWEFQKLYVTVYQYAHQEHSHTFMPTFFLLEAAPSFLAFENELKLKCEAEHQMT